MVRVGVALVLALTAIVAPIHAPVAAIDLPAGGTFFDDDGNIHEPMIEAIAAAGITRGCSDAQADLFCPAAAVTRGQMAAFIRRALSLPPSSDDIFADDGASVFEDDIEALASAGITKGCDADRYCPEAPVTRGQMAAFLVRAFDLPSAPIDPFRDDDDSIFEKEIAALAQAGITKGCDADRYCPEETVTRAQMASFLGRALALTPIQPPPRPSATIAFTGDTLIHLPVSAAAATVGGFDFSPMFDPIRSHVSSADLALCHLEVPLSMTSSDLSGYPTFNAPREVADGLASTGFDGCSTASNHSYDQRAEGVFQTLEALESAGLGHAGTARSPDEAERITMYHLDGLTVAHISATWWLNGFVLPSEQQWLVEEPLDTNRLTNLARRAESEGADLVVMSVHCCVEYETAPTSYQIAVDRALIDSPSIDLVVGHHAHFVQPIEYRNGEYIVYGLGNFLSAQRRRPETIDGVIVFADVALRGDRWIVRSIDYLPTMVEAGTYRIVPATGSSWSRTVRTLESYGAPAVEPVG
jgi:poly-gamma-glutamate synthesis protein (capsule biosynthesis protein)